VQERGGFGLVLRTEGGGELRGIRGDALEMVAEQLRNATAVVVGTVAVIATGLEAVHCGDSRCDLTPAKVGRSRREKNRPSPFPSPGGLVVTHKSRGPLAP
jgi:hypothetical protein